ncbi:Long-chain-fatty-acid--CoA ligase FadD15 [compost metagenome]
MEHLPLAALCRLPEVRKAVEEEVAQANLQLARVEQIKKFHIVGGEWAPGSEAVTATMKIRRQAILKKYADDIETMYGEEEKN